MADAAHWDDRYQTIGSTDVSWFEPEPTVSLALLDALDIGADRSVIDVGGGASMLVDRLLGRGHRDLAVLDLSGAALAEARRRPGSRARSSGSRLTCSPGPRAVAGTSGTTGRSPTSSPPMPTGPPTLEPSPPRWGRGDSS